MCSICKRAAGKMSGLPPCFPLVSLICVHSRGYDTSLPMEENLLTGPAPLLCICGGGLGFAARVVACAPFQKLLQVNYSVFVPALKTAVESFNPVVGMSVVISNF